MKFSERKEKLEYLLEMIEKGRCISTEQLSEKFGVSKRTARRMIQELTNEGNKIKYCRVRKKYYKEIL